MKEGGEEREEGPCSCPRYGIDQINLSISKNLYAEFFLINYMISITC
jgi:hypothetical protein